LRDQSRALPLEIDDRYRLNVAQMLTQNRVQDVPPRLPVDVQNLGVHVRKATPSILLEIPLYSPDKSRDTLYLSNYLTLHVKDALARLQGVHRTMDEVGGALISIALTLCAVFVPSCLPVRHLRSVLPSVRSDDRCLYGHLSPPPVQGLGSAGGFKMMLETFIRKIGQKGRTSE
jgi:AcrB/AcrD/AcrF family